MTHALRGHPAQPQVAIIAGRNSVLERRFRAETWPIPVTVLGFVTNMAEWLAAADLLVTKAGPGALAEAACLGTPALITGYIPGQESGNVTWTVDHGAGIFEPETGRIADRVSDLLRPGNPELARCRLRRARWHGRTLHDRSRTPHSACWPQSASPNRNLKMAQGI